MNDDDQALLRQIAEGDQAAMLQFYDRYFGVVAGYCRKLVFDREAADEAIQDTFWQVWKTAALYDAGRAPVAAWLLTLARSRAIDRMRKISRESERVVIDEEKALAMVSGENVEQTAFLHEMQHEVWDALEQLPEAQRTMIQAVYFRGQTAEDAARRQQVPVGTAKTRLRLGLDKLRKTLGVNADGP